MRACCCLTRSRCTASGAVPSPANAVDTNIVRITCRKAYSYLAHLAMQLSLGACLRSRWAGARDDLQTALDLETAVGQQPSALTLNNLGVLSPLTLVVWFFLQDDYHEDLTGHSQYLLCINLTISCKLQATLRAPSVTGRVPGGTTSWRQRTRSFQPLPQQIMRWHPLRLATPPARFGAPGSCCAGT